MDFATYAKLHRDAVAFAPDFERADEQNRMELETRQLTRERKKLERKLAKKGVAVRDEEAAAEEVIKHIVAFNSAYERNELDAYFAYYAEERTRPRGLPNVATFIEGAFDGVPARIVSQ